MTLIQQRRSIFPKQYSTTNDSLNPQILEHLLEAARWAPSHHLTEAWHFIVFESELQRARVGQFLAQHYQASCQSNGKTFSQAKYEKKVNNALKSTYILALCCNIGKTKRPLEEVCSVACAVQNMHLVATAHRVGAYWSTSGIYAKQQETTESSRNVLMLENPPELLEFLDLLPPQAKEQYVCVGWFFVGPYDETKAWPTGRRKACSYEIRA
jgi:nitroreductase